MVVEGFTFGLPIILGVVIGALEAYFVYSDEGMQAGKEFIKDMWHAALFCVIFTFVAVNIPQILLRLPIDDQLKGFLLIDGAGRSIIVSVVITIFMVLKMVTSKAIKGISAQGIKEKFWHKLLIALLVGFSPYYLIVIANLIGQDILNRYPWI